MNVDCVVEEEKRRTGRRMRSKQRFIVLHLFVCNIHFIVYKTDCRGVLRLRSPTYLTAGNIRRCFYAFSRQNIHNPIPNTTSTATASEWLFFVYFTVRPPMLLLLFDDGRRRRFFFYYHHHSPVLLDALHMWPMKMERKLKTSNEWECTQSGKEGEPENDSFVAAYYPVGLNAAAAAWCLCLCGGKGATTQTKLMIVNDGGGVYTAGIAWPPSSSSSKGQRRRRDEEVEVARE